MLTSFERNQMEEKMALDLTDKTSDRTTKKWITHYRNTERILLVGEGDFSFSACLARAFGSAENMVATSLDSEASLRYKHCTSVENLKVLRELGCVILHGVDVNYMHEHVELSKMEFDMIIFNFPHSGYHYRYRDTSKWLIARHKELLEAFFRNASKMLSDVGQVHVSHRDDHPYNQWKLQEIAENAGLILLEKVAFRMLDYPGYENKKGDGIFSNDTFPLKQSMTFKFCLAKSSSGSDGVALKLSSLHV